MLRRVTEREGRGAQVDHWNAPKPELSAVGVAACGVGAGVPTGVRPVPRSPGGAGSSGDVRMAPVSPGPGAGLAAPVTPGAGVTAGSLAPGSPGGAGVPTGVRPARPPEGTASVRAAKSTGPLTPAEWLDEPYRQLPTVKLPYVPSPPIGPPPKPKVAKPPPPAPTEEELAAAATQAAPPTARKAPFQGGQDLPNLRDLAFKRAPPVFVPGGVVASVIASAVRPHLWPRPVIPPKKRPGFKPPPPSVLAKAGVPIDVEESEDEANRWLRVGPPGPKEERVLPASLSQERVEVMVQPIDHFANPPVAQACLPTNRKGKRQRRRQRLLDWRRKKPLLRCSRLGSALPASSRI